MPAPILQLRGVKLADGHSLLFDGVDVRSKHGVRACLVGRNGAGKSTLLRILAGTDRAGRRRADFGAGPKVALAAQEPVIAGDTLVDYATAGGGAVHQARAALEYFGLDPAQGTEGLSGGEMRRAALARAFAETPTCCCSTSRPTTWTSWPSRPSRRAWRRERAAALIVSHDRAFLERVTRSLLLAGRSARAPAGRGFAASTPGRRRSSRRRPKTSRRLDKAIEREEHWLAFGVTARRARNEGRRRRLDGLRAEKSERMTLDKGDVSFGAPRPPRSGTLVLEAKGLSKAIGGRVLIQDFSTRILRGEQLAIVGPNGAGKTTLVELLLAECRRTPAR